MISMIDGTLTVPRGLRRLIGAGAALMSALLCITGCGPVADAGVRGPKPAAAGPTATATFAGGCFWCMEPPYDKLPGVLSTTSGYTGGTVPDPTYKAVSAGGTGHLEAVRITYDPTQISYADLLYTFWRNIDPLDAGGQFCDRGESYTTAVFYHTPEQRALAEQTKAALAESFGEPVVTQIVAATEFYPAERYHQDYYRKNPVRYKFYRTSCGRDRRLGQLWGDEAGGAPPGG